MKKSELFFNVFLVPLDYLSIVLASVLVYSLRFYSPITESYPVLYELEFGTYFRLSLLASLFVVVIYAIEGLYSMKVTRGYLKEIIKIFSATSAALMIFVLAAFVDKYLFSSRFILIGSWIMIILVVSLERLLIRKFQRYLSLSRGIGTHRVLLAGKNDISDQIMGFFKKNPKIPYKVIARIEHVDKFVLDKFKNKIDEILQCDPKMPAAEVNLLARFCEIHRIEFKYVPNLFAARATNIEIRTLAGFPVVEIKKTPLDGWGRVIKRILDIIISFLIGVLLLPIFVVIAIFIKLDSEGPVFVGLRRVSQGKVIRMLKFRSMIKDASKKKKELMKFNERKDGPLFKMANDPRVTKVGRFLRKTRLDEFPQLINVFLGEMSLVGPRPHEPEEIKHYKFHHKKVLTIKAGVTGMAQVSGSSNLNFEDEVGLDTYYIENWSILLDFIILARTFLIFIKGDKNAC